MSGAEVVVHVPASGKYHRAYQSGDDLLTAEACNLDDAGALVVLESLPADVAHEALCRGCLAVPPQEE